ncbi:DUF402 domain-containing protein [Paenibacillus eucommiae]|uniref:DUF402 domain-containing protein n=1 Tax=Paenibacillus eucommiae TaxID=1355755 RepID=A0ABS4IPS5_9BACL|nr:DUF402 domain-containing protein [Paenibacillus eucommiae]MBP1989572.1 hypothetical protein [Paenibacillus eucommiae]
MLRRVWQDKICRVTAATIVQDTPELIALYWGPGYPLKSAKNLLVVTSGPLNDLCDHTWGASKLLMLVSPGAAHAVYAMWGDDHTFWGWYINLQEPLRRTPIGFDTMDYLLDIQVSPDRCEWSWKDEADFNDAVEAGNISVDLARAIRSEGERAIKLMKEGPSSFYDTWKRWGPPTEWEIPKMPLAWGERYFES